MADQIERRISKRTPKPNLRYKERAEKPKNKLKRKAEENLSNKADVVIKYITPESSQRSSLVMPKKGRICTRQEIRPNLIKQCFTFTIDCQEMAESALDHFNLTVADLEEFLKTNMKVKKGNRVTTEKLDWTLKVHCKKVTNTKDGMNKAYLKLLIKKYLWIRNIRDWVHVEANLPTTLKLLYFRTIE